jgi:hypothetical protein
MGLDGAGPEEKERDKHVTCIGCSEESANERAVLHCQHIVVMWIKE